MNITTKYSIGDKLWIGVTRWIDKSVKCPECEHGYITVTLKSGESNHVKCPKCYGRNRFPAWDYHPIVQEVTIGSVRYDSHEIPEQQVSYMCVETGVGTGSIWYEPLLHLTQAEAEVGAAILTEKARADAKREMAEREERDKANYNE